MSLSTKINYKLFTIDESSQGFLFFSFFWAKYDFCGIMGGRGVSRFITFVDQGGRGDDVICEQPHIDQRYEKKITNI